MKNRNKIYNEIASIIVQLEQEQLESIWATAKALQHKNLQKTIINYDDKQDKSTD